MRDFLITRNAKFYGIHIGSELQEEIRLTQETLRKLSSYFFYQIKNGNIEKFSRYKITFSDGTILNDSAFRDLLIQTTDIFPPNAKSLAAMRSLIHYVIERYKSYLIRNGMDKLLKRKNPISISEDSLYFKDTYIGVDIVKKELYFKTIFCDRGECRTVKYSHSIKEDKLIEYLEKKENNKNKFGGNLKISQGCLIAATKFEVPLLYVPLCVKGFDLNKDTNNWVIFDDGTKFTPNQTIKNLLEQNKNLNEILKDRKFPVKQRKYKAKQRKAFKKLHRSCQNQLKNEIKETICKPIIKKVTDSDALLCIDSVATGATTGSFGQDHIISELITMCENQGVPYYVVPCANTSRRCSDCGHIDKKSRKDTDTFECTKCGFKSCAQLNAAKNIRDLGNEFLSLDIPFGDYRKRNADSLMNEYRDPTPEAAPF
jgi:hypothetical protein